MNDLEYVYMLWLIHDVTGPFYCIHTDVMCVVLVGVWDSMGQKNSLKEIDSSLVAMA